MTFINPLAGPVAQSTVGQTLEATDKVRQLRRQQELQKNVAARDDEMEHLVESSEELRPIEDSHDQAGQEKSRRRKPDPEDSPSDPTDPSRLDLKA